MKSGFVAVVGRPNVGKSTLVNQLVGSKVAITSSKPQTTRSVIRGLVNGDGYQIILVDTPGLHKPRTELGHRLNRAAYSTLSDADVVIFIIDATMPIGPGDRLISEQLFEAKAEVVVAVNKVDKANRGQTVTQLAEAANWPFEEYFPISALNGQGVDAMVAEIVSRLPDGPQFYPPDITTDQPESAVIAEIIREKFLERLEDELPHALVVMVKDIEERRDGLVDIRADVIVERPSQKGIVIGKGGSLLQAAGTEARVELEGILSTKVNLDLHVTVEKDWQRKPMLFDRLGFGELGEQG